MKENNTHQEIKENTYAIIPAYNEANRIGNVITNSLRFVKRAIVVDDGSTDSTFKIAKKTGATVIRHKFNKGKGHALRTGVEYLEKLKPQYIVFLDADGQDNPSFIPSLVVPLVENKADIVLGSRFVNNGKPEVPAHKVIGNKLLTLITNLLTGFVYSIRESQCGFRAFQSEKLFQLDLKATGFEIETEIILEAFKKKLRIIEIPIRENFRPDAIEKGTTVLDGLKIPISLLSRLFVKAFK